MSASISSSGSASDAINSSQEGWFAWAYRCVSTWVWGEGTEKKVELLLTSQVDEHLDMRFFHEHSWSQIISHVAAHKLRDKVVSLSLPPHLSATVIGLQKIFQLCKGIKRLYLSALDPDAIKTLAEQGVTDLNLSTYRS